MTKSIHCTVMDVTATIETIKGDGGKVVDIIPYKQLAREISFTVDRTVILTTTDVVIIYESE